MVDHILSTICADIKDIEKPKMFKADFWSHKGSVDQYSYCNKFFSTTSFCSKCFDFLVQFFLADFRQEFFERFLAFFVDRPDLMMFSNLTIGLKIKGPIVHYQEMTF